MELNQLIFPAPKATYDKTTYSSMVWIPRTRYFSLKRFMDPLKAVSFSEVYEETHFSKEKSDGLRNSFKESKAATSQ